MKKFAVSLLLIIAIPIVAGEINLERVFYQQLQLKYNTVTANWLMKYPTHPVVDITTNPPTIHNGGTATWRWYSETADVGALFRITKEDKIEGHYLYDNRYNGFKISTDTIMTIIETDQEQKKK